MKINIGLVALVSAVLAGCATLPSPSESDGGMLAFPIEAKNNTSYPYYYVYEYIVYDRQSNEQVDRIQMNPAAGIHVRTFGPFPEGDYYLGKTITRVKQSSQRSFSYKPNPKKMFIPFLIEEDTITVLNDHLAVNKRSTGARSTSTSDRISFMGSDLKEQVMLELSENDTDGAWKIRMAP